MDRLILFLSSLTLTLLASSASALISGDVLLSSRSAKYAPATGDEETMSGSAAKVAVHLDPIPLVPVSFGLSVNSVTLGSTDTTPKGTGGEIAVEVKGWLPMVPVITPYARIAYIVSGAYVLDGDVSGIPVKYGFDVSGSTIGFGAEWSPLPLIGVLFEVTTGSLKLEPTKYEASGVAVALAPDKAGYTVTDISLGVSVGI